MSAKRGISRGLLALVLSLAVTTAGAVNINKSIRIGEGEQAEGASTVNGSVTVGSSAIVSGSLETVNGSVRIGDNVQVRSASTVNGSIRVGAGLMTDSIESVNGTIRIGESAEIRDSVSVVNGKITVGPNGRIGGDVGNVNGEIRIEGTTIEGDLTTVTGDVTLTAGTVLNGDLIIEEPSGWSWGRNRSKPEIVIGPNSRVLGTIIAEHEIELYISNSAEVAGVRGEASLEDATRFSGDRP
jgi:predicted acyltransferase (DUF342 family)